MRVLVDCRGIRATRSGGIENYAYCVIRAIADYVDDVVVDVPLPDRNYYADRLEHHPRISLISDPVSGKLALWEDAKGLPASAIRLLRRYQGRVGFTLAGRRPEWARRQNADVVYYPFHGDEPQHPHLPMVTTVHAALPDDSAQMKQTTSAHMAQASAIVTSWPHPFKELLDSGLIDHHRLFMIPFTPWHNITPCGSAAGSPLPLPDQPYYFYPAVIQERKNHLSLIRAIAILRRAGHRVRPVVFAGGGNEPLKQVLMREARLLEISEYVHFLGYVSSEAVAMLYRNCYATISCSLWEAGIATLQEGCAAGRPALVSNIAPALAHCKLLKLKACMFDPRDPQSIASSIVTFELHYSDFLSSAAQAQARIALFDRAFIGSRFADVLAFATKQTQTPSWAPYAPPDEVRD
jgi:glycosyltransferase involved in cell wall biosynthesis